MKRIIKLSLVAVFACVAGYNVYQSQKQVELSGLMLENVEALAGGEGGEDILSIQVSAPILFGINVG